jgi:precorrin-2 dehydrogenase/sirohydrochlorin ferrochelatase
MSTTDVPLPPLPTGYPVVLDLTGRRCLVVGGGPVAARRAEGLLAAGARVTVVAPTTVTRLTAGPDLTLEHRPYRSGEAGSYHLVITATGRQEVDHSVVEDASAAGVLVAGADQSAGGSIQVPAVHRQGPVVVAVATGGASPALARWLVRRLSAALPGRLTELAALVEGARRALRADGRSTDTVAWDALLDRVAPLVEAGRTDEAGAILRGITGRQGAGDGRSLG